MPTPTPQTLQDRKMAAVMAGVGLGDEYARRVRAHLAAGGSPNVYSCQPDYLHSLLGLACHKGQVALVRELLAKGADVHWPEERISRRRWGSEGQPYEGVLLDPLGVCLDMMAGYAAEVPADMPSPAPREGDLARYLEIARQLLRAGANPARKDPAYRTLPLRAMEKVVVRSKLPDAVAEAFVGVVMEMCASPYVPPGVMEHLAKREWRKVGFMSSGWAREMPALAAQVSRAAQVQVLEAGSPPATAIRRRRI